MKNISEATAQKATGDLKARIVEAASRMFAAEGYGNVSARRIAEAAGCSQMAMYRHFPDKASLVTHLCVDLYNRQTMSINEKLDHVKDPEERLITAVRQTIEMAVKNPHYYRLAFLTPLPDANSAEIRAEVAKPAIDFFRRTLREVLPAETTQTQLEEKMRQCFACMHGAIMMLISYPNVYGINRQSAVRDFTEVLRRAIQS